MMKTSAMKTDESPRSVTERFIRFDSDVQEYKDEGWVSDEDVAEAEAIIDDSQHDEEPQTPTNEKRVFIAELPFNSPSQENWDFAPCVKEGFESPSTVSCSSTTMYGDSMLPPAPLSEDDFAGHWLEPSETSEEEEEEEEEDEEEEDAVDEHQYATTIQAAVRQMLAIKEYRKLRIKSLESQIQGLRWFAASKIQSLYRSWHCRMLLRIAILEKRLARSQRRKEYSLHWIDENKKHEMARFDRTTIMVVNKTLARSERDLLKTQKTTEELRSENKKLRRQNETLMEANEIQEEKQSKQQKQLVTYQRYNAMLSSRTPPLEREHKAITNSLTIFEDRIKQFEAAAAQAEEFGEFEKKVQESTKAVILKTLELVKQNCKDKDLLDRIVEMGMAGLEKSDQYAQHVRELTAEKLRALKEKKSTAGKKEEDTAELPEPEEVELSSASDFEMSTSESSSSEDDEEPVREVKKVEEKKVGAPVESSESEAESAKVSKSSVLKSSDEIKEKKKTRMSSKQSSKRSVKSTSESTMGSKSTSKRTLKKSSPTGSKSLAKESQMVEATKSSSLTSKRSVKTVPEQSMGAPSTSKRSVNTVEKSTTKRIVKKVPAGTKSVAAAATKATITTAQKNLRETRNRKSSIESDIKKAAIRLQKVDSV